MNVDRLRIVLFCLSATALLTVIGLRLFVVNKGYGFQVRPPATLSADEAARRMELEAQDYNWTLAAKNLKIIGAAVQAKRKSHKLKPVAEWSTLEDTGLDSLHPILMSLPESVLWVPGQRSFPEGSATNASGGRTVTQFIDKFDFMRSRFTAEELSSILRLRGEDLPIMTDRGAYSAPLLAMSKQPIKVLVLRLSGVVEVRTTTSREGTMEDKEREIYRHL